MTINYYLCTNQTLEGASAEAASLGPSFGVVCKEGVYYLYNGNDIG
jgi:hypothetical protein